MASDDQETTTDTPTETAAETKGEDGHKEELGELLTVGDIPVSAPRYWEEALFGYLRDAAREEPHRAVEHVKVYGAYGNSRDYVLCRMDVRYSAGRWTGLDELGEPFTVPLRTGDFASLLYMMAMDQAKSYRTTSTKEPRRAKEVRITAQLELEDGGTHKLIEGRRCPIEQEDQEPEAAPVLTRQTGDGPREPNVYEQAAAQVGGPLAMSLSFIGDTLTYERGLLTELAKGLLSARGVSTRKPEARYTREDLDREFERGVQVGGAGVLNKAAAWLETDAANETDDIRAELLRQAPEWLSELTAGIKEMGEFFIQQAVGKFFGSS